LLILSGDVPLISASTLSKFIGFHNENRNNLSLISTIVPDPSGYGRIIRNNNGKLVKIVEHKDLNSDGTKLNEINTGIYIVNTEYLFEGLKQIRNENAQQEYYLTDLVEVFLREQLKVDALLIENYIEVLGVNTFDELKYLENVMDTGKEK
jgi:bifunctional N-acetylglucosamine-1-phosphate-uridyltransferase/glucosamine-1-phosphate-acetyltransferase GlmU-like protein